MKSSVPLLKTYFKGNSDSKEYLEVGKHANGSNMQPIIDVKHLSVFYGNSLALKDVTFPTLEKKITAIIGPSGCGKSTLIRCFNRMNDLISNVHIEGAIFLAGKNIYDKEMDVINLRKQVGMVFQRPNPFPKSIYDNIAFGPRLYGVVKKSELDDLVEMSLKQAALWDEVKDKLHQSAFAFSGGQQQRLCIARAIAVEPEVILMDEPCSALDPIATGKIEDLMRELSKEYSITIVTHNMQQAARVSDYTAFFTADKDRAGILVEYGQTSRIFTHPYDKRTEDYITGRFG